MYVEGFGRHQFAMQTQHMAPNRVTVRPVGQGDCSPYARPLAALFELLFPLACVSCGQAGCGLCPACRPNEPMVRLCLPGVEVLAADAYAGGLRSLLIRYKERHQIAYGPDLAGILLESVRASLWPPRAHPPGLAPVDGRRNTAQAWSWAPATVLVPVPSSRRAARARGGNHMSRLARPVARALGAGTHVIEPVRFARTVRESVGLSRAERRLNLSGSMVSRSPAEYGLEAAQVVIVDDVVTTGASLIETARALHAAGWHVRGAAVVAATPKEPGRRNR